MQLRTWLIHGPDLEIGLFAFNVYCTHLSSTYMSSKAPYVQWLQPRGSKNMVLHCLQLPEMKCV